MIRGDAPSLRQPVEVVAKPDFYSFRPITGEVSTYALLEEMAASQREGGSTFARATLVNDLHQPCPEGETPTGIWLEGWLKEPADQGPFEPPLTEAKS